ncbi:hypothetical protein C8R47DRAFT_1180924 [Mycena vitilis]|nr:hypothetical protein C8R47DRAFT_1180924 [Mycena vitilis]
MKHARLYTALPRVGRVRSNSAASSSRTLYTNPPTLQFFDPALPPPPLPNTRLTAHRLPIEARGEVEAPNSGGGTHTTHAPLALAAPHAPASHHPHTHPAQLALLFPYTPGPAPKPGHAHATGAGRATRRRGPRYTLDVGAYGIAKRGQRVRALHTRAEQTDAPLAVQVGEDAYFVRENAMGVADGVGGWARVKHPAPPTGASASALFARRLMHFCADEVDRASHSHSQTYLDPEDAREQEEAQREQARARERSREREEWEREEREEALEAELGELADGLDVLHILERAYERTLGAHVVPAPAAAAPTASVNGRATPSTTPTSPSTPSTTPPLWAKEPKTKTIPLLAGSSTALVAVLDYVPAGEVRGFEVSGASSAAGIAAADLAANATGVKGVKGVKDGVGGAGAGARAGVGGVGITGTAGAGAQDEAELTPVLKIAHVGDCMGMLVRGGEVAWRSEEMWWRWNTPVQLRKSSTSANTPSTGSTHVTPSSAAHLFTLPVQAGDIVILASDGLSDNLWDEDVLEEVERVGRAWGASASASAYPSTWSSASPTSASAGSAPSNAAEVAEASSTEAEAEAELAQIRNGERKPEPRPQYAEVDEDDTPFARRARETGRVYRGGKNDG